MTNAGGLSQTTASLESVKRPFRKLASLEQAEGLPVSTCKERWSSSAVLESPSSHTSSPCHLAGGLIHQASSWTSSPHPYHAFPEAQASQPCRPTHRLVVVCYTCGTSPPLPPAIQYSSMRQIRIQLLIPHVLTNLVYRQIVFSISHVHRTWQEQSLLCTNSSTPKEKTHQVIIMGSYKLLQPDCRNLH